MRKLLCCNFDVGFIYDFNIIPKISQEDGFSFGNWKKIVIRLITLFGELLCIAQVNILSVPTWVYYSIQEMRLFGSKLLSSAKQMSIKLSVQCYTMRYFWGSGGTPYSIQSSDQKKASLNSIVRDPPRPIAQYSNVLRFKWCTPISIEFNSLVTHLTKLSSPASYYSTIAKCITIYMA